MGIQVEQLTKGKTCHQKEFIDFEFNGKHISEFGMVAVFDGDRHSFNASPSFEDETSEVNGVNGQYYWGTRYKARAKTFSLATDGMTEAQMNAFKHHFKPGVYGRFIEDKLANRYAIARVSSEATFSVIPFKKVVTIKGQSVEVNEYKGEAKITFIFDDPFYYATEAVIDPTGGPDALRAMYINNTPAIDSWTSSGTQNCWIGEGQALKPRGGGKISAGSYVHTSSQGNLIYYNPSIGKTKTKITINFTPTVSATSFTYANQLIYFNEIADSINSPQARYKCNQIINYNQAKGNIDYFYYTSPSVIFQINRAIQVVGDYSISNAAAPNIVDLEERLRLDIVNPKVMGWAASVLRIINTKKGIFIDDNGMFLNGTITVGSNAPVRGNLNWVRYFNVFMLCMLAKCTVVEGTGSYHLEDATWVFEPYSVTFDGINSQTTMKYSYNSIVTSLEKYLVEEEKCGDMVCSSYLELEGGDTLDENGNIALTHELIFKKGDNNTLTGYSATLYYQYTYL